MKIISIEYNDIEQEWGFGKISLFDLTLLVGVSGVGKTQILQSIYALKKIANGASLNGVKWDIDFQTLDGKSFSWKGEFENIINNSNFMSSVLADEDNKIEPKIVFEELQEIKSKNLIISRNLDKFFFNNVELPKLNSSESAINILKEEEQIKEIFENFRLIILRDHTQKEGMRYSRLSIEKLKKEYDSFDKIKKSDLNTFDKLALTYEISKDVFKEISERFIDVFPQIEEVKVEPIKEDEFSNFIFEVTVIQIKEKSVNKWIPHNRMSSGMLRTLLHIAEMYLWNDGTVILIDEFENSLGLNCIDVLTEDLLYANTNIQFIATSHHTYIINKVPFDHWKIVTRNGGVISTFDAKDFDLGNSHHDKFLTLINHPYYKNGIS